MQELELISYIVTWTNLIAFFGCIIPVILNFKYYIQLRVTDYLFVAVFFVLYAVDFFITSFAFDLVTIGFFLGLLYDTILFFIFLRTKWVNPSAKMYGIGVISIISALFVLIDNGQTMFGAAPSGLFFAYISRPLIYSFGSYVFLTSSTSKNPRVNRAKYLWITTCTLISLTGFQGLIFVVIFQINFFQLPVIIVYTILLPTLFAIYLLLILHIFFPEAILISYEQLHRAKHLFAQMDNYEKTNPITDLGVSKMIAYIESIPPELRAQLPGLVRRRVDQ